MKTITLQNRRKRLMLNGNGPLGIALLQILGGSVDSKGLSKSELMEALTRGGVLYRAQDDAAAVGSVLQRLMGLGAVSHPSVSGGKWRYKLERMPRVQL